MWGLATGGEEGCARSFVVCLRILISHGDGHTDILVVLPQETVFYGNDGSGVLGRVGSVFESVSVSSV